MSETMKIDEAKEREDVTIGYTDITGYDCVKSNIARLTRSTQKKVLEQIIRGSDDKDIVQTVHEAAASIDPSDPDWDYIGVPQGLGQRIDPDNPGTDDTYGWSKTGDHPRGEAPRAAWFANHLLDVEFAKGDKPKRCKVRGKHTVNGEKVDVIGYNSAHDIPEDKFSIDVAEVQRKCLENPLEDILGAVGIEMKPAMRGQCQSQSGLKQFM